MLEKRLVEMNEDEFLVQVRSCDWYIVVDIENKSLNHYLSLSLSLLF